MSNYLRGAFGIGDTKGDFQSLVSDLKYAATVAAREPNKADALKTRVGHASTAARGSLPRNKFYKAGRGPSVSQLKMAVAHTAGKAKILTMLNDWTASPFDATKYKNLAGCLSASSGSNFEGFVKSALLDNFGDLTLNFSDVTGCWTMNYSADRRGVIDAAIVEARRVLGLVTKADYEKVEYTNGDVNPNIFDAYFGFWACNETAKRDKVKGVFLAVQSELAGSNRCRVIMAPPPPKAGARGTGRDTLGFVRPNAFPQDKGAMIFLGERFFANEKTVADRAATIIHEATHYFAGTVDEDENKTENHCYGRRDCKAMVSDPRAANGGEDAALTNADTYCLFAQDVAARLTVI